MAQQINVNEQTKGTLGVNKGGTGGTTSAVARTNLDVPSNSEAVHITGNETITGTKTFSSNDTFFGDSSKSFADIGNLGTNNEIYIDARSNTYGTASLKLRSKSTGQIELMTNNIPRVYIDGTGNVGVGTWSPAATLDVDGTVRLRTNAGAGKVLTSDANGNATWETSSGGSGTFSGASVTTNALFNTVSTGFTTIPFASESIDTNSFHDNVTNNSRLTVTTAGTYEIRFSGNLSPNTGSQGVVRILKNGVTTILSRNLTVAGPYLHNINMQILQSVSVNDYFEVQIQSQLSADIYINTAQCNFEIIKLG